MLCRVPHYIYQDQRTERQFWIQVIKRENHPNRFYLYEPYPNGLTFDPAAEGPYTCRNEPKIHEAVATVTPNELIAHLRQLDFDPRRLVNYGDPYDAGRVCFDSLEVCAQTIAQALENNVRYESPRELNPFRASPLRS